MSKSFSLWVFSDGNLGTLPETLLKRPLSHKNIEKKVFQKHTNQKVLLEVSSDYWRENLKKWKDRLQIHYAKNN